MALRSLGHRAPLFWLVFTYAAGLAISRFAHGVPVIPGLTGAGIAAVLGLVGARKNYPIWVCTMLLTLVLTGAASYTLHRNRLAEWDHLPPREANLSIRVDRSYTDTFENHGMGLATIIGTEPHLDDLRGQQIYFSLRRDADTPRPVRTAEFETMGVLELLPESPPENTFEGYLAATGMNYTLTRGRLLNQTNPPTTFRKFCADSQNRFAELLGMGIENKRPEQTGVLRAMLLGQKDELSEAQDVLFMHSGTMHLFAISGLHIGVIALGFQALFSLLRLPRTVRLILGLSLLWLYVQITGGTPSAVRAFCMVALLQISFQWKVPGNPLAALTASALLVLLYDPLQLFSASFQLSYGIVGALLLLGLPLGETMIQRWPVFSHLPTSTWHWWHHAISAAWRALIGAWAIGLASVLFSMIAGIQYFGLSTPGALVANLILIPVASFVILAGMGSLLCGMMGFTFGTVLCNHAAALILLVIDRAIRFFVTLPGVFHVAAFKASWIGPMALTLLLGSMLVGYAGGWSRRTGSWWPPLVIVLLTLIFGVNFA
jgi:competence protein ComEC